MHFSNKEVVTSGCARFCLCQLQMRKQALTELLQVNTKGICAYTAAFTCSTP